MTKVGKIEYSPDFKKSENVLKGETITWFRYEPTVSKNLEDIIAFARTKGWDYYSDKGLVDFIRDYVTELEVRNRELEADIKGLLT